MAKRFLDTHYFKSPFVRSLEAPLKLLYSFIICDCSPAGIWTVDLEIAEIYCGLKIANEKTKVFIDSGKAVDLKNGKWFIPGFIEHQYPKGLSATNPAHNNVIEELKMYGLIDENLTLIKGTPKELQSTFEGTKVMVKDKVKDKDKDKVIDENDSEKNQERKKPDERINQAIEHLKQTADLQSLDGTIKDNRQFAYLLLQKIKKEYPDKDETEGVRHIITAACEDSFHRKNTTNFKYLYYNYNKIIKTKQNGHAINSESLMRKIEERFGNKK